MLEHEIKELGRRLGMPDLALNERGFVSLNIKGLGSLTLEVAPEKTGTREGDLLLHVARPALPADVDLPRRALTACSWRNNHRYPLAGGIHKDQLILLSRVPLSEASASLLENVMLFLLERAEETIGN